MSKMLSFIKLSMFCKEFDKDFVVFYLKGMPFLVIVSMNIMKKIFTTHYLLVFYCPK